MLVDGKDGRRSALSSHGPFFVRVIWLSRAESGRADYAAVMYAFAPCCKSRSVSTRGCGYPQSLLSSNLFFFSVQFPSRTRLHRPKHHQRGQEGSVSSGLPLSALLRHTPQPRALFPLNPSQPSTSRPCLSVSPALSVCLSCLESVHQFQKRARERA
ncbi:hypothetical protein BDY21DRAFT_344782 [Lineolata rhizophorae]|uniref:Uncharacterized protein n=1 Tax=Lineolata rhizophorae TaxID=578093 RepID=A0A6A6NZ83_9PEZI|nr:hypothetical protein BDY21DRAFT_344782 [Lineolata rhizophorae]